MNKYLEKIASWETEELEKEAGKSVFWKSVGNAFKGTGKALGQKKGQGLRGFGKDLKDGKGWARTAAVGVPAAAGATYLATRE